jgi:hypothetical protein
MAQKLITGTLLVQPKTIVMSILDMWTPGMLDSLPNKHISLRTSKLEKFSREHPRVWMPNIVTMQVQATMIGPPTLMQDMDMRGERCLLSRIQRSEREISVIEQKPDA